MNSIMKLLKSQSVTGKIICGLIYSIFYEYVYSEFTFKVFEYMGVEHNIWSTMNWIMYLIISTLPLIFYKGLISISSAFTFIVYLFAYIPMIESVFSTYNMTTIMRLEYGISLFICMILFFLTDNQTYFKKFVLSGKKLFNYNILLTSTIFFILVCLITNINNLHFVNPLSEREIMYEMRAELSEDRSFGMGYLIKYITNVALPILLISAFVGKQRRKIYILAACYLLMFMITMQKVTFVLPFILCFIISIIKRYKNIAVYNAHSFIIISIIVISIPLILLRENSVLFSIAVVLFYRTVCVSGHLFSEYVDFFQQNPYTYYTHNNVINNLFGGYPYDDVLGRVVVGGVMNANANFLITDGIAAAGIIGIWLIAFLFIVVKGTLNSLKYRYNIFSCIVIFIPSMMSLLNVSLFTSLITGGILIIYFLLRSSNLPYLNQ